jgi:hypothetical protein
MIFFAILSTLWLNHHGVIFVVNIAKIEAKATYRFVYNG